MAKSKRAQSKSVYRENINFIPQESYLFSDTIENNIGFAIDNPTKALVEEFAKVADVHKNIVGFKDQYNTNGWGKR